MRTKPSCLPKILQWVFAGCQVLALGGTLLVVGALLLLEHAQGKGPRDLHVSLGEVQIELPANSYSLSSASIRGGSIQFDHVTGTIDVSRPTDVSSFLKATRGPGVSLFGFVGITIFAMCELLRRLFRNVSRGETFTEANVGNVHKLGVLIIVLTLGGAVLSGWARYEIATYLEANLEVAGVSIDYSPPLDKKGMNIFVGSFPLQVDLAGLLMGVTVLALGEAFRQGLKLKEETDLTI